MFLRILFGIFLVYVLDIYVGIPKCILAGQKTWMAKHECAKAEKSLKIDYSGPGSEAPGRPGPSPEPRPFGFGPPMCLFAFGPPWSRSV